MIHIWLILEIVEGKREEYLRLHDDHLLEEEQESETRTRPWLVLTDPQLRMTTCAKAAAFHVTAIAHSCQSNLILKILHSAESLQ